MGRAGFVASFTDLRLFARDFLSSVPMPGKIVRRELPLPPGPVSVGVLVLPQGRHPDVAEADEFFVVHAGSVTIECDGVGTRIDAGESFVVRSGTALRWEVRDSATLIFMRYRTASAAEPGIVGIDRGAELAASGSPAAELLVTPIPSCRNHTDYRSEDGEFVCGVWDSTPYARKAMRYRHFELMHLLDGEVTFVDAAGRQGTFAGDDIFLVEKDAECSWDSKVYVRKVYAIWRPA